MHMRAGKTALGTGPHESEAHWVVNMGRSHMSSCQTQTDTIYKNIKKCKTVNISTKEYIKRRRECLVNCPEAAY